MHLVLREGETSKVKTIYLMWAILKLKFCIVLKPLYVRIMQWSSTRRPIILFSDATVARLGATGEGPEVPSFSGHEFSGSTAEPEDWPTGA
jgi:hypothetical protein